MGSLNTKYNYNLAGYFANQPFYLDDKALKKPNVRKSAELVWQQINAQLWNEVIETLCNVFFIEVRAKADMLDLQQEEFGEVISLISDSENRQCLDDFYNIFMEQKHILRKYPELTFQQLYNELQWSKDKAKIKIEESRTAFLSKNNCYLHQYRKPQITHAMGRIYTLSGHVGKINSCAFSPDGESIVSGSEDKTLKIWDILTGREKFTISGHNGSVEFCAFSLDGKQIFSWGRDNNIKIWDAETGNEVYSLNVKKLTSCAFSFDGRRIVTLSQTLKQSNSGEIFGIDDKTLKIWDIATSKEIINIKGIGPDASSCSFSMDGKQIVTVNGHDDKTLNIWDVETGMVIRTLTDNSEESVKNCMFFPDGKRILSICYDKTLKIWDIESGRKIKDLIGHLSDINCCAILNDGRRIITGSSDRTLKIWDTDKDTEIFTLEGYSASIKCCSISPDEKQLVASIDNDLKIRDIKLETNLNSYKGHKNLNSCSFSPDIKKIISWSYDSTLKFWDVESGSEITILKGHSSYVNCCAISPDNKLIVSGSDYLFANDNNNFKLWDISTCKEIAILSGHYGSITSCAFSPDGRRIISGATDNTIKLWNVETGREIYTLIGHSKEITFCSFSTDGKRIFSGSLDETIKIWDSETGLEIFTLNCSFNSKNSFAISPDNNKIVTVSGPLIKLWDTFTGKETIIPNKHNKDIRSCAYSMDGRLIVFGYSDKTLSIRDANTGQEILSLAGHSKSVIFCAFSNDNKRIISGSEDKTIKFWDALTGQELSTLINVNIRSFSISNCGTEFALGDGSDNFYLFKLIGFAIGIPLLTRVRLWINNSLDHGGRWDEDITSVCPYCGIRFPCSIPNDATYDDPRLLSNCPNCGRKLKFNPFVVDNQHRK
jgi:WD40 repeat protein